MLIEPLSWSVFGAIDNSDDIRFETNERGEQICSFETGRQNTCVTRCNDHMLYCMQNCLLFMRTNGPKNVHKN